MKSSMRAMALAVAVTLSVGAQYTGGHDLRVAAGWNQLSDQQRHLIDLVARDIWDERNDRAVTYDALPRREKEDLRDEAMERLGFELPRIAGVEV